MQREMAALEIPDFPRSRPAYASLISDALRTQVPSLGQKLWKAVPGLSFLRDQEHFYRLDLAVGLSIFLLIAVWSYGISSCSFGCPTEMSPKRLEC